MIGVETIAWLKLIGLILLAIIIIVAFIFQLTSDDAAHYAYCPHEDPKR